MTVQVIATNTQTATLDTEHTLAAVATAGIYQLLIDTNELQNGDILILRCKLNVTAPGSPSNERVFFAQVYAHRQGDPAKCSIPVTVPYQALWTLEQTDGTGRTFPWTLVKL